MTLLDPEMMPFSRVLGLEITHSDKQRVAGELTVTEALCTTGRIMHGGAVMTLADTLGAIGAFLNLPEGHKTTTTIESKTNFLRAAPLDSKVTAECIPLHAGRRMSVWQTTISNEEGKTVAVVTQTQMVL
ncbi:MAG: PaaI family thioesterase [Gammaproteobacteria bacterium]|mgnify:CR=1 FL=1|jgi:1,4-dihydroxy-2-naphthoyl-CoA hydrolase|nr:PaaI family thioesterase [Gammaproteobacteria bacterium]MBT7369035.1 PaaI family thioesterase [Gammaproteobacteria bacterium]